MNYQQWQRKNKVNNEREDPQENEWKLCNVQLEIQPIWFIETPAADCVAIWDTSLGTRLEGQCCRL